MNSEDPPITRSIKTEVLDYQENFQDETITENQSHNSFDLKIEPEALKCVKLELVDETEIEEYTNDTETNVFIKSDLKCDDKVNSDFSIKPELECEDNAHLKRTKLQFLICDHCDFIGNTKAAVEVHRYTAHPETTLHVCKYCDFSTHHQVSLERHVIIVHKILGTFKCAYCSYVGKTASCLKIHKNEKHLEIKKFECSFCSYKSCKKFNLQRHLRSMHNEIKHKCSFCNFSTKDRLMLQKHKKAHHLKDKIYGPILQL